MIEFDYVVLTFAVWRLLMLMLQRSTKRGTENFVSVSGTIKFDFGNRLMWCTRMYNVW